MPHLTETPHPRSSSLSSAGLSTHKRAPASPSLPSQQPAGRPPLSPVSRPIPFFSSSSTCPFSRSLAPQSLKPRLGEVFPSPSGGSRSREAAVQFLRVRFERNAHTHGRERCPTVVPRAAFGTSSHPERKAGCGTPLFLPTTSLPLVPSRDLFGGGSLASETFAGEVSARFLRRFYLGFLVLHHSRLNSPAYLLHSESKRFSSTHYLHAHSLLPLSEVAPQFLLSLSTVPPCAPWLSPPS